MTIELARRLIDAGAPTSAVERALFADVVEGVPFVAALGERSPELSPLLERELARAPVPEIHWVKPARELVAALPSGLCERLLAVPVQLDSSGRVDVAAAEVLDPHVAAEFAYHLGTEVRVLRADHAQIRRALSSLSSESSRPPPARAASDAPIPLVRRPPLSPRPAARPSEPVLNLARSKLFSPEPGFSFELELTAALAAIEQASSADAVARELCRALEPALVLVGRIRGGALEIRAASHAFVPGAFDEFSLALGAGSIVDFALEAGFYLGPLSASLVHAELRVLLPEGTADEVYATPVLVAGRPVLILLMASFGPSLEATRRADRLSRAAASALERVIAQRRRGT